MRVQFKLHAPKPGDFLPDPHNANMSWELDVLPRKGERVVLSAWDYVVVTVEHAVHYGRSGRDGEVVGLTSVSIIYLKRRG